MIILFYVLEEQGLKIQTQWLTALKAWVAIRSKKKTILFLNRLE